MSDNKVNLNIDYVAEQWVRLILSHIEAKKQISNASKNKKKERKLKHASI